MDGERLNSVTNLNLIDKDGRCFGFWEPAFVAKLLNEVVRPDWEILFQKASPFGCIGSIGLVEGTLRSVRMHISAIITPSCGLIPQSQFDDIRQAVPSCKSRFGSQRTSMSEGFLRFFVEMMGKDSLLHQTVQETSRATSIVLVGKVFRRRNEDILRIPTDESETLGFPNPISISIPVVMVPVGIAAIKIDEHEMDEVIHIEQRRIFYIRLTVGTTTNQVHITRMVGEIVDEVGHPIPSVDSSRHRNCSMIVPCTSVNLGHIPVFLQTSKAVRAIFTVHSLAQIVHSPVKTVEKEVDILSRTNRIAKLCLRFSRPKIASILSFVALSIVPMLPRIAEESTKNKCVELLWSPFPEDSILETLGSVIAFEMESESVFRILFGQSSVTSMQFQTTIYR